MTPNPSKKRFRRLLANMGLLLVTLLIMTLMAELALRLVAKPPAGSALVTMYEFEPALSWRPMPSCTHQIKTAEFQTQFVTNELGFRGEVFPPEKPADVYRIVALGDSFAEGQHVPLAQLFSEQLRVLLDGNPLIAGKKAQALNTGVCGYNTAQELLMFETVGKRYQPDLTIVLVCYNDILFNAQDWDQFHQVPLPHYELADGKLRLANVPLPQVKDKPFDDAPAQLTWKSWLVSHSAICKLIRNTVNNHQGLLTLAVRLGIKKLPAEMRMDASGRIDAIPLEYYLWKKPYTDEIAQAWAMTEALLLEINRQAVECGSRFLILNVPSLAEIEPAVLKDTREKYGIPADWNPHQIGQELEAICARNNLTALCDLEPWLAKTATLGQQNQSLYFRQDGHWNETGHRFVAEMIFEKMRKLSPPESNNPD